MITRKEVQSIIKEALSVDAEDTSHISSQEKSYIDCLNSLGVISEHDEVMKVVHEFLMEVKKQLSEHRKESMKSAIDGILEDTMRSNGWLEDEEPSKILSDMIYKK